MARAKHTDRTEARRRHRAEQASLAAVSADATETMETDVPAKGAPSTKPKAAAPAAAPGARPSIVGAFRAAFTPLDLRGDLRALPRLLIHWSMLVPIGLAIASTVVFIAAFNPMVAGIPASDSTALGNVIRENQIPYLAFQFFAYPPPVAGAFLLGFTIRRASWLGGLILGIVAAICFAVVVSQPASHVLILDGNPASAWEYALLVSPVGALLFASAAAWYRRFLNLANPNRGKPQAKTGGKPKPKPATARGGARR